MPRKYKRVDLFHIPSTNDRVEKFINFVMKDGKKNVARRIFQDTLKEIQNSGHTNPMLVWETAVENASPNIMVKSRRIGGAVYAIPLEIKGTKRFFYSAKRLLDSARGKKGQPMYKKLTKELLEAYTGQGAAVKKKEEAHRNAEANKANAYLAKYL
jgi:small subunit ribosomal protein S7